MARIRTQKLQVSPVAEYLSSNHLHAHIRIHNERPEPQVKKARAVSFQVIYTIWAGDLYEDLKQRAAGELF